MAACSCAHLVLVTSALRGKVCRDWSRTWPRLQRGVWVAVAVAPASMGRALDSRASVEISRVLGIPSADSCLLGCGKAHVGEFASWQWWDTHREHGRAAWR